jgi:glycosyltransferase involved in cell wall biosynthesis
MKIAHLIWGLDVGGAETMLVDIANEQASSAEVAIMVGNAAIDGSVFDSLSSKVVTSLVRRPPGSWNPWHLLKLIHMLRKFSPDIIHAHHASFAKIARALSAPMVLTVHATNLRLESSERYAAIYGISEAVRNDLMARHSIRSPMVIHNGICFSKIPQKTSYGQFPFRIVQVGLLHHDKKGQDILLRALKHVSGEMGDGKVLIDFIGAGTSREYLCNLAEQLGIAKWCRFLGRQARSVIYDQLRTYDLLVQPSRYEGFGLTIVEAMAARVPVLVSDIEGPMEVIDHGNYGYYFRAGDHVDCGEKIAVVIKDSQRDSIQGHLQGVAEYARRRFDVATTARNYLDEYKNVILRATPA